MPPGPKLVSIRMAAGEFSNWLQTTETALLSGNTTVEVPCGSCRGCCRSSMFIHIRPTETETLRGIPKRLLFPAPGLPKGHVLMGYDDKGQCPMFVDNRCSIYEFRPQTCRDYDCRVFTATNIPVDESRQPEIAQRVSNWRFTYRRPQGRAEQAALRRAARFLQDNRHLFPDGALPNAPGALAAIAIRIFRLFLKPDSPTVQAILSNLRGQA